MNNSSRTDDDDALAEAQEAIAHQAEEINRLRSQLVNDRFAEELRRGFGLASIASTIASPVTLNRLLEMIVQTAVHVISAEAAALYLIDKATEELTFEVAIGGGGEKLKKFRLPPGQGFAGFVALTGEAIAVEDVKNDPRHSRYIAESVGYMPRNMLCVPMFFKDQIIGVLQLCDRQGADSFSITDINLLGLFANQAAVTIEQSQTNQNLTLLISEVLLSLGLSSSDHNERLHAFISSTLENTTYRQALDLAKLVQEITMQGETEVKACQTILRGFVDYLHSRPLAMDERGVRQ